MRVSRITAALAAVPLMISGTAGAALADDISNNLDATVDAVAEIMPLNMGASGTTQLYVSPQNDDGKQGCNLTGSKTLTLSLSSSDTAVATVSPALVTFTSCGTTHDVIVTPVATGTATISVAQESNTTGASFDLAPASFKVNVAGPANTAPEVAVTGVTGGGIYDKGVAPTATCQVTDSEDGNSTFAATLGPITGPYASDGVGSQTASCSFTDKGGLTAVASETYSIVDPSGPVITYDLSPATPNGSNDWYTGDVSLTWGVTDPESPGSIAKDGCDDQTITADQTATEYSCAATSAGGSAVQQTVTIKRDATAPSVSFDGVTSGIVGDNGWYRSDVTVTFTATDATSGPATATETVTSSGEGEAVVVDSPAFSDLAGNTTAAGAGTKTFKIDSSAPNPPQVSLSPAPNGAKWNNSDVVVKFTADGDNGASGVAACTADLPVATETAGQEVTGTCIDRAGNVSAETKVTVKLDKTGPVISDIVTVDGTKGAGDWYTSDVHVTFTATDALSGLATTTQTVTSSGEGEAVVVNSPAFTDVAGNTTAAGAFTQSFKIDKTKPTVPTFIGATGDYYYGNDPAAPTCTSTDAVSGVASCVVTGGGSSVGSHTYTATATDNAGNTSTATLNYEVLAWTMKGFYSPVDMSGVWNTVKGGSTVPLKFEVFAGAAELTNTSVIKSFTVKPVACPGASAPADAIEFVTTGGTSLRYDTTGGQFIQNWQTPKKPGSCYEVTMTAQDASAITAKFMLK